MADQGQKTEQPTQKRQEKARSEGQFATARDFLGALQFAVFLTLIAAWGAGWMLQIQSSTRAMLVDAFERSAHERDWIGMLSQLLKDTFVPLGVGGLVLVVATLAMQLAMTRLGFSLKRLMPSFSRLNPLTRLKELPKQNFPATLQAAGLLVLFGWVLYAVANEHMAVFFTLPLTGLTSGLQQLAGVMKAVVWKMTAVLIAFGAIDLFRQLRKHSSQLKMTKQEVRDEAKESEGNPQMKARIRRIRRDLLRRQMMKDVKTATAVVVNPTHFAVAIRYQMDSPNGPMVVAKGKNYLALRIKQRAMDHDVLIVENPPLARALYDACEVGQEIPVEFYRAVAEILAYIYRLMGRRLPA